MTGNAPCEVCGRHPSPSAPGINCSTAVDILSFARWCSLLTVSVLRTLHLERSLAASLTPAFPLPVPFPGIFAKMPSGLSAAKRRRYHFHRALHVMVMALNYWWSSSSFIPVELLERAPSASQQKIFRRLASLSRYLGVADVFLNW